MKVVFLDIDGVLNNDESFKKKYEYFQKYHSIISEIDEETVKRLARIVKTTSAKVVLTSSWRSDWKNGVDHLTTEKARQLQELFWKNGIEIIGITPCLPRTNDPCEKYTSWRENEILDYLKRHREITDFCIIDDEIFDLFSLQDYVIKTDRHYGLQEEQISMAIQLLMNKELQKVRHIR